MRKQVESRIRKLEADKPKDQGPMYISIAEGEEIPEGFTGKVYIGWGGPDEWDIDPDEDNKNELERESAKEKE